MANFRVYDLEMLSKISLSGYEKSPHQCKAYWSGVMTGLYIAREFCRAGVKNPNSKFWEMLLQNSYPKPKLETFLNRLEEYTNSEFFLPGEMVFNNDLRTNEATADLYARGLSDAVEIAIKQAPKVFELVASDAVVATMDWLASKMRWARQNMQIYL